MDGKEIHLAGSHAFAGLEAGTGPGSVCLGVG